MKTTHAIMAVALSALALAGCSQEPAELPYGTTQLFMANHVQPTAEIYWQSVGAASELIDGEPTFREWAPETDEEWQAVADAAAQLRQFGETLATPAYAADRGEDWLDFAQGLQEAAALAETAANEHDPEKVFEAGGTVYSVCSACHQMYPPAELPDGMTVDDLPAEQADGSAGQ